MTLTRRSFIAAMSSAAVGAAILPRHALAEGARPALQARILARLQTLEAEARGRLGVHILDTADGATYGYRANERFQTLSSFKMLASALVLHRVDRGLESLDRRIPITPADIITWSPVTEKHVGGPGMSLAALCEATITTATTPPPTSFWIATAARRPSPPTCARWATASRASTAASPS